jgi:hypothetical protein
LIRKLLVLTATAASVVVCAAFVTSDSNGATADQVRLTVQTRSIDGALLFSSTSGWSWRCILSENRTCSVNTERGRMITVTAENGAASSFYAWDGLCAGYGSQPTCAVQMNQNLSVAARFSPLRLRIPVFGRGSISVERYPSRTRLQGRWCGQECADFAYGETLRLRPVASQGAHMAAWGGSCERVRASANCLLVMNRNGVVSATFEEDGHPTSPSDCEPRPDRTCQPVKDGRNFYVRIVGPGMVIAPKMDIYAQNTCETYKGVLCPSFWYPKDAEVELRAYAPSGGRFRGWVGGQCRGTGVCRYKNRRVRGEPTTITARFG